MELEVYFHFNIILKLLEVGFQFKDFSPKLETRFHFVGAGFIPARIY